VGIKCTVTVIRLKRADAASGQWYRDRVKVLRDEHRSINQSAQTPEEKTARYKSLQGRARALAAEFAKIKAQNRLAHGLSDDGTPLPQEATRAVPGSAAPTLDEPGAVESCTQSASRLFRSN
jgi:hypothetical protein